MTRVGLISDTHGLLRPEALAFLAGCDHIVHAGDICEPGVLDAIARVAPLTAVRGNNDYGPWADALREIERVTIEGITIVAIHDVSQLRGSSTKGAAVVVSGHSHRPLIQRRDGILFVNPGSAGPRRFTLPISIGELVIDGGSVTARTTQLDNASR